MAYTNQKAVSSYILLQVKPKLPSVKIRSHRFPDATGGMDSGFSLCTAPAFCCGPGISKIGRYMCVLQVTGKLQGQRMTREGFWSCAKSNNRVVRVIQFLGAEIL